MIDFGRISKMYGLKGEAERRSTLSSLSIPLVPFLRLLIPLTHSLSLSLSPSADDEPTATEAPQHLLWVAADSFIWGGSRVGPARAAARQPLSPWLIALRVIKATWVARLLA